MNTQERIQKFLAGKRFAVVGASQDRSKYGNKVLRVYQQNKLDVVPINPHVAEVEGLAAYRDLASVPGEIDGVSIITPPAVTECVVADAIDAASKTFGCSPVPRVRPLSKRPRIRRQRYRRRTVRTRLRYAIMSSRRDVWVTP